MTTQETVIGFQILPFFSSFLNDVIKITKDLKKHVYNLIGIDASHLRILNITSNIYSIMEGCHKTFEDLRRVETLLRGHLNGKLQVERQKDSIRQSRQSARNSEFSSAKNYQSNAFYQLNNIQLANQQPSFPLNYQQNAITQLENNDYGRRSQGATSNPKINERPLMESKSQGHLLRTVQPVPPTQTDSNRSETLTNKTPRQLIQKIRQQLGLNSSR